MCAVTWIVSDPAVQSRPKNPEIYKYNLQGLSNEMLLRASTRNEVKSNYKIEKLTGSNRQLNFWQTDQPVGLVKLASRQSRISDRTPTPVDPPSL